MPDVTEKEPLWATLGVDPVKQQVVVIGYDTDRTAALAKADRYPDAAYINVFNLMAIQDGSEIYKWLCSCGLARDRAKQAVRDLGRVIGDMFRKIATEKGWEKPHA